MGPGTMGVVGPRESSYNPGEKVLPPPEEPEPEPAPDEPTVAPPGFTVPVGGSDDAALRAAQVRLSRLYLPLSRNDACGNRVKHDCQTSKTG